MAAKSLYICYFGVGEPLVQTQVISYLRELAAGGHEMSLLTFEPGEVDEKAIRERLAADGIEWHWLKYHKRPSVPATMFDIANGARVIRALTAKHGFEILHARSHVPMMMATLARKSSRKKPKLLFDIRGFMPEEYVDAGIWPEGGSVYRAVKKAEARLMKEADGFVVLTERARKILSEQIGDRPVEVVPCCVDLARFESATPESRRQIREEFGIGDRFTLTYVGAFGGWYLTKETADFFGALKRERPDAFALILTQSDPAMIEPLLKEEGYGEGDYFVGRVPSADIPRYLSAADAAVSFIKVCYSKQASSPTKNAEYLACGLPIVVNDGIGDTTEFTLADATGIVIEKFSADAYDRAIRELSDLVSDEHTAERSKKSARSRFDLKTVGGARYREIYSKLVGS